MTNYYVIEVKANGDEEVLAEFADLLDAMSEQKKLRRKVPEESSVLIQDKNTFKFLKEWRKKQKCN